MVNVPAPLSAASGRRGYLRYQYGTHYWVPDIQAGWSKGMVRDTARVAIPPGSVYDSADYLLHRPGLAEKRGGTAYAGPAMTGASYAIGLIHAPFVGGAQLLAVGSNGHLFKVTSGTTTDLGALNATGYIPPIMSPGSTYVILPYGVAGNVQKYDGAAISTLSTGFTLLNAATYKSRVLGSGTNNRNFFSPTPDVNIAWDTANSWVDSANVVSGYATLNSALLIFSANGMERIIGSTPPPNTDLDLAPVSPIGCTDARSIVQVGPNIFFANPEGVYLTNGGEPVNMTDQGGISTYWQSLFSGYVMAAPIATASTWTISAGWWRGFLFVSVLNASRVLQATLMCNVATRAWWRVTNVAAMAYTTSVDGTELYYADGSTNRVVALSGILAPAAGNKNDANGTAVAPTIEFAPFGSGTGTKAYGFGHLDFDMRDAASDNPTMAVTIKEGIEALISSTPAESPLTETSTLTRPRFTVAKEAQAVTIALAQTNASSKTELYALEVETRGRPLTGEGVS